MALTVVKNLETLCPIDNPKTMIIGNDNHFSTIGVFAHLFLKFSQTEEDEGHDLTERTRLSSK